MKIPNNDVRGFSISDRYFNVHFSNAESDDDDAAVNIRMARIEIVRKFHRSWAVDESAWLQAQRRFWKEAVVGSKLRHPNLIKVYDFDIVDDVLRLTMQSTDFSLGNWLWERLELPWIELAVGWLEDAARGLEVLHEAGVIHRNVNLDCVQLWGWHHRRAAIGDFGHAQVNESFFGEFVEFARPWIDEEITQHPGTPGYMSPEHFKPAPLEPASDVYSLGCVAFEFLTRKQYAQVKGQVQGPADLRTDVPSWLNELVKDMLVEDANQRIRSMTEVLERIVVGCAEQVVTQEQELGYWQEIVHRQKRSADLCVKRAEELKQRPLRAKWEEAELRAQREAELRAKWQEAEQCARQEAEQRARQEAEQRAKQEAEQRAKQEAEQRAKQEAEQRAKREASRRAQEGAVRLLLITGGLLVMRWIMTPAAPPSWAEVASRQATAASFGVHSPYSMLFEETPMQIIQLQVGSDFMCAITDEGGVKCRGVNQSGQLGNGQDVTSWNWVQAVGLDRGVRAITAGGSHACALTDRGQVKCWGDQDGLQPANGQAKYANTPQDVAGLGSDVAAISAGLFHTCAVMKSGDVKCWGRNEHGQLGNGRTTDTWEPQDVTGLGSTAVAIAAGGEHTCALLRSGDVKCWGWNQVGQLGNSKTTDASTPQDVVGLSDKVSAIAAGRNHTCAVLSSGGVKCWGSNDSGQLGSGGELSAYPVPVSVVGASGVASIAAGAVHTCAVMDRPGKMTCWGGNEFGQLGNGGKEESVVAKPQEVVGLKGAVESIALGDSLSCAQVARTWYCWGDNRLGQLGEGGANLPIR